MSDVTEDVTAEPEAGPPLDLDLPEDPTAAVPVLLEAVAAARSETAARLDDLQRVAAEFVGYALREIRGDDMREARMRIARHSLESVS